MKKYIANVVCKGYFKEQEMYNVVNDINKIDNDLPTIIIGWEIVKNLFPETSILEWKINEKLYWTHLKNVKRTRFEEDMKKFKEIAIRNINNSVKYVSFNMMIHSNERIMNMCNFISSGEQKYCYIADNEVYVYSYGDRKTIGISLYEADYTGIGREYIKSIVKSNGNKVIYNDYDIPWGIKDKIANKKYMVPFLVHMFDNE